MLPPDDLAYLATRFPNFREATEGQMLCVVITDFPVAAGLRPERSDLLLRLAPGYPDIAPDMWWFAPAIIRLDGAEIPQTQAQESYLGQTWQRWSRHLDPSQWRPGVDGLQTYLALVTGELSAVA